MSMPNFAHLLDILLQFGLTSHQISLTMIGNDLQQKLQIPSSLVRVLLYSCISATPLPAVSITTFRVARQRFATA